MTKLCYKIKGCDLEVGDEVFMPSTVGQNNNPYEHDNLTGTIFAFQEDDYEYNNHGYIVAVLLDQDYDVIGQKHFSVLGGTPNFNDWKRYEEFVIQKGHVGKYFRWFPIHEVHVTRERTLPMILERLEKEIK